MRPTEYDAMFQLEDSYWWFEGSMRFILSEFGDIPTGKTGRVLDAGCGTGGLLRRLAHRKAWGVEIASEGIRFCQQRGLDNILRPPSPSFRFGLTASTSSCPSTYSSTNGCRTT